jgi:hypothetical protein
LLTDATTFEARTLESLLDTASALNADTVGLVRHRYLG